MSQFNRLSSILYGLLLLAFSIIVLYSNGQLKDSQLPDINLTNLPQDANAETLDDPYQKDDMADESEQDSLLLQSALALSKQGAIQQAISVYEEIISRNDNHQIASVNLAVLMLRQHGCEKALANINHAITISRGSRLAKGLSIKGYCLAESRQFEQAIAAFNRSIEFRPNHAVTWRRLAKAQQALGVEVTTVITTMERALSLDSNNNDWRMHLAEFQHERLDFRGSINTIKDSYSSMKTSYSAQVLLAWNYLELERWNNAKKHIEISEELDKSKFELLKAMKFYSEKDYEKSIDVLLKNKKMNNDKRYLLALNYKARKWYKNAKKHFLRTQKKSSFKLKSSLNLIGVTNSDVEPIKINQTFTWLLSNGAIPYYPSYLAAKYLVEMDDFIGAEKWLSNLDYPNKIKQANNLYAHVVWSQDKKQLAIDVLTKLVNQNKKNNLSIRQLSGYLLINKQSEQALAMLEKINMADYKVEDFLLKSNIYIALNQLNKAESLLLEGVEYWSDNTEIRFKLSQVFRQTNKNLKSKQQLSLILKLDQSHPEAKKYLAEFY
jgi:tetratricopeptide (TPR) repeat protein